ncbi:MAG TPA: NAD-dependent epimerase/dehydratase family protein [Candidatus Saccharimonadales bacterium]|nr:NAD-dependent epimerase/dehydratase family protein [Candidatus Saccharimonadales bacterium]
MNKLVITGVGGFVGQHVATLAQNTWEVHGIGYNPEINNALRATLSSYTARDLTDESAVQRLNVEDSNTVIHLAGLASPFESFSQPAKFIADNTSMLINLCEPILAAKSKTRIIMISTGALYAGDQAMPLTESSRTAAANPYVVSKLAMEDLASYYRARGLDIIVVRPFNHIGPGQLPGYLVPDLVSKLQTYRKTNDPMKVGNLATRRDYTDVRDVARAYLALATATNLSDTTYNVCSGVSHSGQEILQMLARIMEIELPDVAIQVDRSLIRPTDIAEIYGSNELLRGATGWQPTIALEQTLKDTIEAA